MKTFFALILIVVVVVIASGQVGQHNTHAASPRAQQTAATPLPEHSGTYAVIGKPTISAAKIDKVLHAAGSPADGTGATLYDLGIQYGIDPAFALAFFDHESNYGTQGVARYSLSLGNLRCIDSARCVGGYAYFDTWAQGYEAWYTLIAGPIYVKNGLTTVETIIPVYAPPADSNDDSAYIAGVEQMIQLYRSAPDAMA
jgi:hypothetical protein